MSTLYQYSDRYRLLEEFHGTVTNARKRRRSSLAVTGILKVRVDVGVIRKLNQDIEDRHRQFMVRAPSTTFEILS